MSKKQALTGIFWNGTESFFLQLIQLFVSMILARLLTPVDFGLIALISVFIAVTDTIAAGGFRSTIVMRPHLAEIDFSTAFVYNLAVAAVLYLAMFFSAPLIASFYDEPKLIELLRVLALVNLIHAGYFVQDALLQRRMRFKFLAQRNILAALISGAVAIGLAFFGFGVWALVSLTLTRALVINVYLWSHSVWKFSLDFSWESFKKNFGFGYRMMLTHLSGVLFANLNNLLIGKFYTKADLGYYYQARKLKNIPVNSATAILTKTASPLLAKYQEDLTELHKTYFHITRIAALCIIPIVLMLFVVSRDLVTVLFTKKWLESVVIFRIIIIAGLFSPFIIINGLSPAVMGDSKFFLRIDLLFKGFVLLVTFIALRFGLYVFIACQTSIAFVQMIMNSFIARKYYKVGIKSQLGVYLPYYVYSLIAGAAAWLISLIQGLPPVVRLIVSVVVFISVFVSIIYTLDRKTFLDSIQLARTAMSKYKSRK